MVKRVGFIGLGDMGEPMARNLCGGDFDVMVYDLREDILKDFTELGARVGESAQEVGEHAEVVGICVINDAGTLAVAKQVFSGAAPGTIVAVHGTVSPECIEELVKLAGECGCHVVDAQVTGGRPRASERQLRYMVGAEDEVFARCRPVFETSAAEITHCGPVGMGAIAKLCNNLVQFQAWQGYVEADMLAEKTGLSREKLFEVLSWIMNDNARVFLAGRGALVQNPENEMIRDRFSSAKELAAKDLKLAAELGRKHGIELSVTEFGAEHLARLFGLGDSQDD
jgi:3-hydroxyisobutyrate dehydrogenase-like beta-hydroxyacid dehydrogenase